MQSVSKSYQQAWRVVRKSPVKARTFKRTAHKRMRAATHAWLGDERWDDAVIEARGVTDRDVV